MRDGDLRLRDALLDLRGALVDRLDPVVQVIDLPAARKLAPHGLVQNTVLMLEDEGLHGIAVGGGLLDGGHVPDAGQRHVQRPGNGRSGEGQHVHALGKLLQPLFMADAEALLLVHNEQTQILELDGFLQQLMGPDD